MKNNHPSKFVSTDFAFRKRLVIEAKTVVSKRSEKTKRKKERKKGDEIIRVNYPYEKPA